MAKITERKRYGTYPQKQSGVVMPIFRGVLFSLLTALISIVFLTILNLTTESLFLDQYMQYIMVGITMISIFIGSAFATLHIESKGLLVGVAVGCIYVLISIALGMKMSHESVTLLMLANKLFAGMAAGALGGLIGVNL